MTVFFNDPKLRSPADGAATSTDVRHSAQSYLARLRQNRARSSNVQGSVMRPRAAKPADAAAIPHVTAVDPVGSVPLPFVPVAPSRSTEARDDVLARLRGLGKTGHSASTQADPVADFAARLAQSAVSHPAAPAAPLPADAAPAYVAEALPTPVAPPERPHLEIHALDEGDTMPLSTIPAITAPKLTGLGWVRARAEARTRARQAQAEQAQSRRLHRAELVNERQAKEEESRAHRANARQAMSVASAASLAAKRDARAKLELSRQAQEGKTNLQRQQIAQARAQQIAARAARAQHLLAQRSAAQKAERDRCEQADRQRAKAQTLVAEKAARQKAVAKPVAKPVAKVAEPVRSRPKPAPVARKPKLAVAVQTVAPSSMPDVAPAARTNAHSSAPPKSIFATPPRAPAALSRIQGLGSAMQRRLVQIGIQSADDLVAADPQTLRSQLGPISALANVERWIDDAKQVVENQP